jgi:hypothetical protein
MGILLKVLSVLTVVSEMIEKRTVPADKLASLLDYIVALGKEGEAAGDELKRLYEQIKVAAASNGTLPWDEWEQRHAAAHARLQALKNRED